ncbi:MAG: DNA primase [Desulfohalobiaceae bacterium]
MSGSDRQAIDDIKSRLDLLELIGRYVQLRQAGQRWVGVCPFHQETKPSLSVNPEQGFFYCFGCQAGGDAIDFYCRINGLEFAEGLRELAQETGVKLQGDKGKSSGVNKSWGKICLQANALAQEYFSLALQTTPGAQARHYLQERGVSQEMVQRFCLGWSPGKWQGLKDYLHSRGISPEQGLQAGLLSSNSRGKVYDRFRDRITFPIHDLQGRILAFGGRVLKDQEGQPKYLNSSESPVFKKGEQLYGLYQARKAVTQSKQVLLTEGYADVISLVQYGFENTCGVLGTALTKEQIKRLSGLCDTVYLLFDGDRAGQQAALRSTQMILSAGLQARVAALPEGEDVDSVLHKQGAGALEQLLHSAQEGLAFCLQMIRLDYCPQRITNWARDFLLQLGDQALQAFYLPRLAEGLDLSEALLRQSLQNKAPAQSKAWEQQAQGLQHKTGAQRDRELLQFAICYPQYLQELQELGLEECLQTQRANDFWQKLVQYGHDRVYPYLDQLEGNFFARCLSAQDKGDVPQPEMWQDIRGLLLRNKRRQRQQRLRLALREAQEEGDTARTSELLTEYSNLLREEE